MTKPSRHWNLSRSKYRNSKSYNRIWWEAVNAILAKEQFYKWKKQVVTLVGEKIGAGYRKRLSKDWLETAFAGADMYDELSDDIEMCLRHLYQLSSEIETQGLQASEFKRNPVNLMPVIRYFGLRIVNF